MADLLVVGGTPAGVAAAVTAARHGLRVELVSQSSDLGGVLTDAMMNQWDLNLTDDGRSVEGGIFSEIYARLGEAFSPLSAAATFAEMVRAEPRIDVRYSEVPLAVDQTPVADGKRIDGVTFRNARTGALTDLHASFAIDATDFGDFAALAGARYDVGRQDSGIDTRTQSVTLMFTLSGVDWNEVRYGYNAARFGSGGTTERTAWGYQRLVAAYRPASSDILVRDLNLGREADGTVSVNAIDVVGVNPLDPAQLAEARLDAMFEAPRLAAYLRGHVPGFEFARVATYAPQLYVRETRHIAGLETLSTMDVWDGRIPQDSIGLACYPIDVHPVDLTDRDVFAATRHVYGVPLGTLVPRGFTNVMLASPAISASHFAAGSARTIPTTIEEGEAGGTAVALALRERIDIVQLATSGPDIALLRRDLAGEGAIVGEPAFRKLARSAGRTG